MSTQTLDAYKTSKTDDGEKVFHYVRKNDITKSAVEGTPVLALCGEVFIVTRSPKPNSPICTSCKEIYEGKV